MDLSTYVLVGEYLLPEPTRTAAPANSLLAQEASAVTYDWDTDTLFVVGDGGTSIVQVSKTGQLINSMTLAPGGSPQGTAFYDPEGLTYIGNGQFVMTEERDRNAVLFTYAAGTTLDRSGAQIAHLGTNVGNVGLEGATWDPATGGFIFVKETTPEGIFQTTIDFAHDTASNGSATTVNSVNLFDPSLLGLLDFADVFALSNIPSLAGTSEAGRLLVLSQESGKIVETDRNGNVLSSLTIVSSPNNPLSVVAQQWEGLTVDRNGYLYVVAENGGGDFDHPMLRVYAPSSVANMAPTGISLTGVVSSIAENTGTAVRIKVAGVSVADDGLGTNNLAVTGADAAYFEVDSTGLYIRAGTVLDYETKSSYSVTVTVDDPNVGGTPDASTPFTLSVTDVVNETLLPRVYISEVAAWSSSNSPVAADWFELTNGGSSALNLTGWKMDDNSNSFAASVALSGITTVAPGESVIFIESSNLAAARTAFINTWFGGTAPAGLQIGVYSGSGVGLSTGGDAVNVYDSTGVLQANVSFGPSPNGPFATFNNAAGLNNAGISTLSVVGQNGAFTAAADAQEIGSPGTVGRLFISEVAPWSSGNSPVAADWFEVTNSTVSAINITGWKMDDNSGSFAAAVALNGITTIAPGESVIFIESADPVGARTAFINTWFGGNAPANLQIGTYTGSGVGLSTGGDAVNLYSAAGLLQASVAFGVSPSGPYPTFDNAAGLNNVTLTALSAVGVNAAFAAVNDRAEIGSPGEIVVVNDAPIARDDTLSAIGENAAPRTISFASLLANDLAGPANESGQTLTLISVGNAVGGTLGIVGTDVIFTPTTGFAGQASFDYTVRDNGTSYGIAAPLTDVGTVRFTINDAPTFTSPANFTVAENSLAVGTVTATDLEHETMRFALTGGADRALFAIDPASGALRFLASPDFESFEDANGDNVYALQVSATDSFGNVRTQSVTVTLTDVAEAGQTLTNGNRGGQLTGGLGNDIIDGANGSDVLIGGDGNDQLSGGNGNDVLSGGRGADVLRGGNGDDRMMGGAGNDVLEGGNGDDVLVGGTGVDTLTGGNGSDRFIFEAGDSLFSSPDTITDFHPGDRIDLAALGTSWAALSVTAIAGGTLLGADLDHNGSMDFGLIVLGATAPGAGDFIF